MFESLGHALRVADPPADSSWNGVAPSDCWIAWMLCGEQCLMSWGGHEMI